LFAIINKLLTPTPLKRPDIQQVATMCRKWETYLNTQHGGRSGSGNGSQKENKLNILQRSKIGATIATLNAPKLNVLSTNTDADTDDEFIQSVRSSANTPTPIPTSPSPAPSQSNVQDADQDDFGDWQPFDKSASTANTTTATTTNTDTDTTIINTTSTERPRKARAIPPPLPPGYNSTSTATATSTSTGTATAMLFSLPTTDENVTTPFDESNEDHGKADQPQNKHRDEQEHANENENESDGEWSDHQSAAAAASSNTIPTDNIKSSKAARTPQKNADSGTTLPPPIPSRLTRPPIHHSSSDSTIDLIHLLAPTSPSRSKTATELGSSQYNFDNFFHAKTVAK
jgi:hypothetical protein